MSSSGEGWDSAALPDDVYAVGSWVTFWVVPTSSKNQTINWLATDLVDNGEVCYLSLIISYRTTVLGRHISMNFLRVSAEKEAIPLPCFDWTIVPVGTEERQRVSWAWSYSDALWYHLGGHLRPKWREMLTHRSKVSYTYVPGLLTWATKLNPGCCAMKNLSGRCHEFLGGSF